MKIYYFYNKGKIKVTKLKHSSTIYTCENWTSFQFSLFYIIVKMNTNAHVKA